MKKRVKIVSLLMATMFLITGCGGQTDGSSKSTKTGSEQTEKVNVKAQIEEKVIVDRDGIKITAKSLEYDSYGVNIKLLIENNSTQDITVQARDFSINGIMIDPTMSQDVSAGKKANSDISIDSSDLTDVKINTITDMEFGLTVFEESSWENIFEETGITLTTNAKNYTQEYNTEGTLVVDQNDVKIYVLKLDDTDSFYGSKVTVYIENNTNEPVTVQARDVSVNGYMIDYTFSSAVMPGKKSYDEIGFYETALKENGITDITNIDLKFIVFNTNTWEDIFTTDTININF